ncbi:LysE family translocator [Ideonella sp. B508-1]|uniref:LysE family translocator n=1 Tax=Ideonella sp. B508-1 TaxID=137716 RepID=UPI0003B378B7|nr:LysE family translocator [Ideonella sp. B508-1]
MTALVLAMGTFALMGAITPGPVNVLAIRHGAAAGRLTALAYVLGASLSYALVVWLMGQGGAWLLHEAWAVQGARWLGAAYLLHLAWRIATAPPMALAGPADAPRHAAWAALAALRDGGLTQSLNPKAWLVALSGIGLFVLPQADAQAALGLFCAVSLLACGLGVGCWALAGRLLAQALAPPARQQGFNRAMGALLALSVASMLG